MTLPMTTCQPLPPGALDAAWALHARLRTAAAWLAACLLALLLAACGGGDDGPIDGPITPAITAQPASVSVKAGAVASFSVSVTGSDPITYQWRRNGTDIAGATASSYRLDAVTAADTGAQFSVVVSNAAGSVTSVAATLAVDSTVAPALTVAPVAQSVTSGLTATFSVTVTGSGPLAYQWTRNGVAIAGATAPSHTTPVLTAADDGARYAVVVSNAAGSASSDAVRLTVTAATVPASITTQPVAQAVTAGQTATFAVAAAGTAPLTYQWKRNRTDIAGATAASYTTAATTVAGDNGALFSVVVNNAANAPVTSAAVALTVGTADVAVSITAQPAGASVTAGQAASFTVVAAGTAPQYQWQRDGAAIAGATSATYTIANTAVGDSGARFAVVVSNSVNSVTSAAATLTVGAVVIAPNVPAAQPGDASVTAPATATFSVAPQGTAPFSYQWRRNGTAISGATAASYTTPASAVADDGALYSVVVSNSAGSATSRDARLSVAAAPVAPSITTQPSDATATVGQTATFSVVAAGTGPLSYQWRKNGTAVTGATAASFTTPAVVSTDNGALYSVVVSNGQGADTSRAALLTVSAPGVMVGRTWVAAQSLEENTSALPVLSRSSTIDDAGRVTVIFRKNNGSRDALYATRGIPNGAGQAATWSTPVLIDLQGTTAVSNMAAGVQMSVTAAPGGDVVALWNHFAACTASTYGSPPFQCRYYYVARYRVAADSWDAPALLTDTPDGSFTTFFNDRGDTVFLGNSWIPFGTLRSTAVKAVFMKTAAEATFRRQLLSSEPTTAFQTLQMDMDASGRLLLATQFSLNGVSEILAYRGTSAAGLGSPFQLDTLAARAVLEQTRVGRNGQQVVVWYHPDVGANRYAAASADAGANFTVTDLGANSPGDSLSVTDAGSAILCTPGCRFRQTWTPQAGWAASAFTGTLFFTYDDLARETAISRNGDLLWVDGVGTTATYDAVLNAAVIANTSATNLTYVLGLANGSAGYVKPLLSISGIGFVDMLNTYDVLPTPAAPAGVVRANVSSLWGAFLK